MLKELTGVWQHDAEYQGIRSQTTIAIKPEGSFVTRMEYQMPDGCQIVEHRGKVAASKTELKITLVEGYTQDEAGQTDGQPMKPFTEEEFRETQRMLAKSIPYRLTESGELATEPEGPAGKLSIVYSRVEKTK